MSALKKQPLGVSSVEHDSPYPCQSESSLFSRLDLTLRGLSNSSIPAGITLAFLGAVIG